MMAEMLTKLRAAMNEKVLQANDRIIELESSKVHTAEKVKELEKELASKNSEILELKSKTDDTSKSVSAINGAHEENTELLSKDISETPVSITSSDKYSALNEALKDEALRLDSENEILRRQNDEFKKYMDDQVFQLTNFNNLIKEQQSTISKLESKILKSNQDSVEWQKKYMDLQSEVTSFKIVYGIDEETGLLDADLEQEIGDDVNVANETPDEISNSELVYPKNSANGGNNKRVLSKSRNVSTNEF
ncbi:unnamed protein product [[Candida] boidinii]|nr:unnamed protein product [[Candida] boidinii]